MLDHKKSITLYRRLVPKTNWETDVTEWSETGNCSLITRVCYIGLRCKTLTFKTRLSAKLFLWKWVLFAWKPKTILISMALQLASLWNRGLGQRGDGLFSSGGEGRYPLFRGTQIKDHKTLRRTTEASFLRNCLNILKWILWRSWLEKGLRPSSFLRGRP